MVGISLCGSYVPVFRVDRGLIAKAWGKGSVAGERSLANNDEDSITMAVEASINCLAGRKREDIQGLFFATTTAPYVEKMNSALIAAAVDLSRDALTQDFAHSLRSATGALRLAFDSVKSGSLTKVLVATADCRIGYPGTEQEQNFGDGAAALLVGKENVIATMEGSHCVSSEMMDVWRGNQDVFVNTWEARFILEEGYINHMKEVVKGILEKQGLKPQNITKVIFPAPDARSHKNLIEQLGFNPDTQAQDPLISTIGYCGTAQPMLMLVGALEQSSPGDTLLLASYADGADAILFKVTEEIRRNGSQRRLKDYLNQKIMFSSYARFLSYKGLVETAPGEPLRLMSSATVTWRDSKSIIRCHGSRCRRCGILTFPVQRVCYGCGGKDDFEEEPLSHLEGEVFTFTLDNLAGRSDDPVVIQTVAELGTDKVRFYSMMTDCVPSEVRMGMPVGLTFRKLYEGAGMHNYFWKCRPLRRKGMNDG